MNCKEIRERMPDVAAGFSQLTANDDKHLDSCEDCTQELKAMRATMALLDEWEVPEPSPFFDVRLQARLREEMVKPQAGWLQWFRRPVLAAALTVLLGVGVGLFFARGGGGIIHHGQDAAVTETPAPGSAVSDLQTLDKNDDLYADFDLLDDLDLQQDVTATP